MFEKIIFLLAFLINPNLCESLKRQMMYYTDILKSYNVDVHPSFK